MAGSIYFPDADVSTLVDQITQIPRTDDDVILLFIGEHSTFATHELLAALKKQQIPVAGGVSKINMSSAENGFSSLMKSVSPVPYL